MYDRRVRVDLPACRQLIKEFNDNGRGQINCVPTVISYGGNCIVSIVSLHGRTRGDELSSARVTRIYYDP